MKERSPPSRHRCGRSELALQGALRRWPSSTGRQAHSADHWPHSVDRWPESQLVRQIALGRRCARRRRGFSQSTQQQQRGNIGTCPLLNKKGSLALGMVATETRGCIAARPAEGTLPWIGVGDAAEGQRLQAQLAASMHEAANFQHGGPEKLTGAQDPLCRTSTLPTPESELSGSH